MLQRAAATFTCSKAHLHEQNKAAVDFVQWITAPAQSAKWTIATGYVAPRAETWDSEEMKAYTADFAPALVARDQLAFLQRLNCRAYQNQRIVGLFNDALASRDHRQERSSNCTERSSGSSRRDPG